MKTFFASIALLMSACSSHPLDPGAGDQAGSGTKTLLVNGSADAEPNTPNTSETTQFTTHFDVEVSLNNTAVTTGTVTVRSHTGTTDLTFDPNGGQFGRWSGSIANYDEVYAFDVTSGSDKVTGVYVDGPDIHTFMAPTAGATIDSTMPTNVTWRRDAHADQTTFRVGDGGAGITIDDTGTYSMTAGSMKTDGTQARPNTLRLTRTNNVTPAGAVAGSQLSVSVAQELDVVAAPCPGC
jgi:hypothetical protein